VPDQGAAPAPVQPEERDQVDRGQGGAWQHVHVGAVADVQPEGAHGHPEQGLVHVALDAVAVLVGLDLDHGRLDRAGEPGDRPGVRVGLLELVGRAVDGELPHLGQGAVGGHEAGQRRTAGRPDELVQGGGHVGGGQPRPRLLQHPGLESLLEPALEGQQRRLPLPAVVDPGEPAVAQLVEDVEGQGGVVPVQRVVDRPRPAGQMVGRLPEMVEEEGGQRSARSRQPDRLQLLGALNGAVAHASRPLRWLVVGLVNHAPPPETGPAADPQGHISRPAHGAGSNRCTRGDTMTQLFANTTTVTRAPAYQDRADADRVDQVERDREARRSRVWTLIEALAYAGAFVDPSGILAVERLRRAEAEEERDGRR
jgi:hypothetical protein